MVKAGSEYEELVALVASAFHSEADIRTGQWIEGPDGKREVDVEVRGEIDGNPHFIHIECKDWKRPVDINAIDNLDSKRRDIDADAAMIYSNSGFTKKALCKAERIGIDALSAFAEGNNLVRPMIERELVVKKLSVDTFQITLYPSKLSEKEFPRKWDYRTLRYDGLPFANWLTTLSSRLLRSHVGEQNIVETVAFKAETPFTLEGVPVLLRGFRANLTCSKTWVSQTVREDVSLGHYNHITRRLTIPNQQFWSMGVIDQEAWGEIDIQGEPEDWGKSPEPGTFRLDLTLLHPVPPIENEDTPEIDELIGERRTDLE